MKQIFFTILTACAIGLAGAGCAGLLTKQASQNSFPVLMGNATTNDLQSIAWLREAQSINAQATPAPYNQAVAALIGAAIALMSSASTYFQHKNSTPTKT